MAQSFVIDGRRFRRIARGGREYVIGGESTKLTLWEEFGIVYVGGDYSYTTPAGRVLQGYSNEPVFVSEFAELRAEEDRL